MTDMESDCEHVWILEVQKRRTFGGVDINRFETCEECGEVREASGSDDNKGTSGT